MKRVVAAAGLALALTGGTGGLALAQDEFKAALEARQGLMALYTANAGPLFAMAKGEMDYDAEAAQAFADNLASLAALDQRNLWPPGSDSDSLPDRSRAKPEIWSDFPDILEKSQAFTDATANLAAVAGNGLEALGPAVGAVGKSCGTCHEPYRVSDS